MKIFRRFVPLLITVVVVIIAYTMLKDDLKSFLLFAFLILVFSIYSFDFRILIASGISLLIVTAVLTSQRADYSANEVAVLSYWLLVAGVVCLLIELCRKAIQKREVYPSNAH